MIPGLLQSFTAAMLTIVKNRQLTKCILAGEWIDKSQYIQTLDYYTAV